MKISQGVLVLALAAAAVSAQAEDGLGQRIATQGNDKGASACISCHGANGEGLAAASFPMLAGQGQAYLQKQLADYRAGRRGNPIMQPIASALSDDEAAAVTGYFAAMPAPQPAPSTLTPGQAKPAEKLAVSGDWGRNIPACFACHGPGGRGVAPNFPAIAGQHASYVEAQLNAWKAGTRKNDQDQLMKGVAARMTATEVQAVAAWLASFKSAN